MLKTLLAILHFWYLVGKRFDEDNCFSRATALAYTTLLSLVPLLTVSFTILAIFPTFKSTSLQIQDFIFTNFVPASGQVIQNYFQQFIAQAAHLSLISSVSLLITAVLLLYTIDQTFHTIWKKCKPRKKLKAILLYCAILILAPLLVGLSFIVSSYLLSLPFISYTTQLLGLTKFLLLIAPFLLNTLAFILLYKALPNCPVPWHASISGALVAAILFELAKLGFSLYIRLFPSYELIYGALAAIPIFLIWIYLSWLVVLFGAEVSHVLTHQTMESVAPN